MICSGSSSKSEIKTIKPRRRICPANSSRIFATLVSPAGPRASQFLILGAKARTILQGRYAVSIEDIQAMAPSVLRHRIVPNFKAQGEGISSLDIVNRLLADVKGSTDGAARR